MKSLLPSSVMYIDFVGGEKEISLTANIQGALLILRPFCEVVLVCFGVFYVLQMHLCVLCVKCISVCKTVFMTQQTSVLAFFTAQA